MFVAVELVMYIIIPATAVGNLTPWLLLPTVDTRLSSFVRTVAFACTVPAVLMLVPTDLILYEVTVTFDPVMFPVTASKFVVLSNVKLALPFAVLASLNII